MHYSLLRHTRELSNLHDPNFHPVSGNNRAIGNGILLSYVALVIIRYLDFFSYFILNSFYDYQVQWSSLLKYQLLLILPSSSFFSFIVFSFLQGLLLWNMHILSKIIQYQIQLLYLEEGT